MNEKNFMTLLEKLAKYVPEDAKLPLAKELVETPTRAGVGGKRLAYYICKTLNIPVESILEWTVSHPNQTFIDTFGPQLRKMTRQKEREQILKLVSVVLNVEGRYIPKFTFEELEQMKMTPMQRFRTLFNLIRSHIDMKWRSTYNKDEYFNCTREQLDKVIFPVMHQAGVNESKEIVELWKDINKKGGK